MEGYGGAEREEELAAACVFWIHTHTYHHTHTHILKHQEADVLARHSHLRTPHTPPPPPFPASSHPHTRVHTHQHVHHTDTGQERYVYTDLISTRGNKLSATYTHFHPPLHPPPPHRYFAMFSGMGWETVTGCRQYFYIRHIDWAITCPLIIFSLGILATQDLATTLAGEGEFAVSYGFFFFFSYELAHLLSGG
jgi:hypothetical protein